MRKMIIYFIIVFFTFSCQNKNKIESEPSSDVSIPIDVENLSIDSLAQYFEKKGSDLKIKNALPNNNGFYVYFQLINNHPKNLKLYIQYEDHNIYQFSIDGERYTYKTDKSKGRGDNKICWYDYPVKTIDLKLLRSIIKSDSGRIIFSDGTSVLIEQTTKDGIRKTLRYFELLGGQFPPYL